MHTPSPVLSRVVRVVAAATVVVVCAGPPTAHPQSAFESPPTLTAPTLAPGVPLKGPRYQVADSVPVKALLGQFSIRSDFGALQAHGVDVLRVRVAEMAALDTLEKTSKSQEFAKAAGTAAARPVKAGVHMVTNPGETAKGMQAGASRFFDRVSMGYRYVADAASESGKSESEKAEEVGKRIGSTTADVFGWEEERRALAKRLGVDPYTTNPILSAKLDDYAWVTFSGRVGLNAIVAVVVPASMVMTATSVTNDVVWDMKPADVIKAATDKLAAMGAQDAHVRALLKNPWYSLTTLSWLVNGLAVLEGVVGRADVVAFASTAADEDQARFVATAINMLAVQHAKTPLATVGPHGTVIAHTRTGVVIVPAPVDYIAWTERVAAFASRPDVKGTEHTLLTTAKLSARTRKELAALGWTVTDVAPLTPPAVSLPTTSR